MRAGADKPPLSCTKGATPMRAAAALLLMAQFGSSGQAHDRGHLANSHDGLQQAFLPGEILALSHDRLHGDADLAHFFSQRFEMPADAVTHEGAADVGQSTTLGMEHAVELVPP